MAHVTFVYTLFNCYIVVWIQMRQTKQQSNCFVITAPWDDQWKHTGLKSVITPSKTINTQHIKPAWDMKRVIHSFDPGIPRWLGWTKLQSVCLL